MSCCKLYSLISMFTPPGMGSAAQVLMQLEKGFQSVQNLHELLQTLLRYSIEGAVDAMTHATANIAGEGILIRSEPP